MSWQKQTTGRYYINGALQQKWHSELLCLDCIEFNTGTFLIQSNPKLYVSMREIDESVAGYCGDEFVCRRVIDKQSKHCRLNIHLTDQNLGSTPLRMEPAPLHQSSTPCHDLPTADPVAIGSLVSGWPCSVSMSRGRGCAAPLTRSRRHTALGCQSATSTARRAAASATGLAGIVT